jgi:hypothetical protein
MRELTAFCVLLTSMYETTKAHTYRTGRVDAGDGAMAGVDAQRLWEPVSYPRLQRRRSAGREALREVGGCRCLGVVVVVIVG